MTDSGRTPGAAPSPPAGGGRAVEARLWRQALKDDGLARMLMLATAIAVIAGIAAAMNRL